jgi:hypothetical protein
MPLICWNHLAPLVACKGFFINFSVPPDSSNDPRFSCTFSSDEHWALTYDGSCTAKLLDMTSNGTIVAEVEVDFQTHRSPQPSALHFSEDCKTAIVIDDQGAVFISCDYGTVTDRISKYLPSWPNN